MLPCGGGILLVELPNCLTCVVSYPRESNCSESSVSVILVNCIFIVLYSCWGTVWNSVFVFARYICTILKSAVSTHCSFTVLESEVLVSIETLGTVVFNFGATFLHVGPDRNIGEIFGV